jgi:DNA processing protein
MLAGNEHLLKRSCVTLVGARNASLNGRKLAESLARELAQEGFLVVLGMARGIETAAHTGALDVATAAVLAVGIDVIYPPENAALHKDLRSRGVLIGEMALRTEPQARHFPRRNRIISGLSLGVVVIEAAMRSGSLITARFANEQGREVMAVPGSPLDSRARGCNDLLRQRATLVESAEDVVRAIAQQSRPLDEPDFGDFDDTAPGIPSETEVAQAMWTLLKLLGPSPTPVDELIRQCQFSSALVRYLLLELEFADRVQRHPGNRVSLLMDPDA